MPSTQTIYRYKRLAIIKDIIFILIYFLETDKKNLDKLSYPFLKNIKKSLEPYVNDNIEQKKFYYYSRNGHDM